jgi:hypothetical protein
MTSGTFIIMIVMVPALLFSVAVVVLIEERCRA